ncbi:MAG: response regulator transcription factor [Spirochaetales bacterium]|nr:response regulator transcription factor [Spirochaetales bacterium]
MHGRILIIEDTVELAELYAMYLRNEGFVCTLRDDAESALPAALEEDWDLIILDLNLPGMDGFQFLEQLRKHKPTPVMILTAREADEDIIFGLGVGADDFVVKPCPPKVLAARVRAHIRRVESLRARNGGTLVQFGPFELDIEGMYLTREGQPVNLSAREFGLLKTLIVHAGKPFTPEELYHLVWGQDFGDISAVGVYIQRLRKKLEDNPSSPYYIQTQYGLGYRFNPEALSRESS